MNVNLLSKWEAMRTSYWFVPALMSVLAAALSVLMLWIDGQYEDYIPYDVWWIYGGGPEGARELLGAIVASMITVTSVVFSITIVALTLAAGQFGTRLLRNFMRDTGNQVVLGTFIATFIYSLLVLRTVRGMDDAEFVPHLAITTGVLMVFCSVGVLIYFIHHVSTSLQADYVINSVSKEIREAIDRLFPTDDDEPPQDSTSEADVELPDDVDEDARPIQAPKSNYLQAVEMDELVELAHKHDLLLKLPFRPGQFVVEGSTMLLAWPPERVDEGLEHKLADNLLFGAHRTMTQDIEFGINQLVEIAVRALSTGINDPYTAIACIDRLSAVLCTIATRSLPSPCRFDEDGALRIITETPSFPRYVDAAFNQIRQNAASSPAVLIRLMEGIGRVAGHARSEQHTAVLQKHAEMVRTLALDAFSEEHDREDLLRRYHRVMALLREPERYPSGT